MGIKIKFSCFVLTVLVSQTLLAQMIELKGQLIAPDDVEGIHVRNTTSNIFTISNQNGNFVIPVKLNDSLVFSSVSYEKRTVIVTQILLDSRSIIVSLSENVTVLDEVVVGKILTGDLRMDLANSGIERNINFFDLGIAGYTGEPKTQSERRLYTAGDFKPIHLLALLGGSLPLDPILNAISGRTKLLKNRIQLERLNDCIVLITSDFSERLFKDNPLAGQHHNVFYYFCADDAKFSQLCANQNSFEMFAFLQSKLLSFKSNLQNNSEN